MTESDPERGEVWWVDFDPAVGSEPAKNRPAAVVSGEDLAHLPTRIVVPLTTWRPRHAGQWNKLLVRRDESKDLDVDSAADVALIRVVDLQRFGERMGVLATATSTPATISSTTSVAGHRRGA